MNIIIDHDQCGHGGAFSDRCLANTLLHPLGHERYCLRHLEDDGRPELRVTLRFDGEEHTRVLRTSEEIQEAAAIGWPAFTQAPE